MESELLKVQKQHEAATTKAALVVKLYEAEQIKKDKQQLRLYKKYSLLRLMSLSYNGDPELY